MAGKGQTVSGDNLTPEDRKAGFILVELGPKLINRTKETDPARMRHGIFHEADDRHPNKGEALVVHGKVVKVAVTARVREALAHELIVESEKPETPSTDVADAMSAMATRQVAALVEKTAELAAKDAEIEALKAQLAAQAEQADKVESAKKA